MGQIIKPLLILSEKVHLKRFYQDLKDEVLVDMLNSSYANDELN
jgi:hypothetical protein